MKAEVELTALDLGQSVWAAMNSIELYCIRRTGLVHMDATRLSGTHLGRLFPQHRCDVRWPVVLGQVQKIRKSDVPPY